MKNEVVRSALEDAMALQEIMSDQRLETCLKKATINAVNMNKVLCECRQKEEVSKRVSTFKTNLNKVLSSYMIEKMAKAGINFPDICRVFQEMGSKGVIAVLAGGDQKARVTIKVDIIAKTIYKVILEKLTISSKNNEQK